MEWVIGIIALYCAYHVLMGYLIQKAKDRNRRNGID